MGTALSLAPESNSGVVSWSCSFSRLLEIRAPCIRNLFLPDWSRTTMDQIQQHLDPLKQFAKDSVRCTKPDRKEFSKIAIATTIGFGIMGFIGFFVKLIHIPINNIIVGA